MASKRNQLITVRFAAVGTAAFLLVLGASFASHGATFTATLDRDTIKLGEQATLSLTFSGGAPSVEPTLPKIPNLQSGQVGTSQNMTINNGQVTSTTAYNFMLSPTQVGDFQIPALTVEVNGQKLSSQPLQLKVLKPDAPPPAGANAATQLAFLRLTLPRTNIYVGEMLAARLELYLLDRIGGAQFSQPPTFSADAFSIGQMKEGQQRMAQAGNANYRVVPFDVPLKALKAGNFTLGPVTARLVVEVPSSNRQRDPFFDRFGFDVFGGSERREIGVGSEGVTVHCLPLPRDNVPPGFNGAVGAYNLTMSAGPTNVGTGDPITVKIQISGRGALDALTLPEQSDWKGFKVYPPESHIQPGDALGLQGVKSFEEVVTPESAELKLLPPFVFSFFDPDQKAYRTLKSAAIPLTVRPNASVAAPVVGARAGQETAPPAQDIIPLKQHPGTLANIDVPLLQRPWFLAAQVIPVLTWLGALLWRRRAEEFANNPRLRRKRLVAQRLREGLGQLRRFADERNSNEFFATLFRLLQELLGERLDLPASSITEAVIEERLRPRNAPEEVIGPLQELFQGCNMARYAPVQTTQEMAVLIPKFEGLSRSMEKLRL